MQTLIEEGFTPEEAKTIQIQKGKGCGVCRQQVRARNTPTCMKTRQIVGLRPAGSH